MKLHLASFVSKLISHLLLLRYSLFSGKILSVRALCTDASSRIYLVRHTYTLGWHLPGGGVDNGMSAKEALLKELREEGNLVAITDPVLQQVYLTTNIPRREHIIFYTASVSQEQVFNGNLEISEGRFFAIDALPADLDPAAQRRISEWVIGEFKAQEW
ncbi:MAG: DNA mismatch repair protein MutT [Shinella sp.]|nr:MAG: DNA mismatch repair protein MutT [Shinella sp.]